jgi:hypothetical protein
VAKLTEHTLMPIGLAITVIGSAAVWMTTIHLATAANSERLGHLVQKEEKYSDDMASIRTDVAIIKTELRRLNSRCDWRGPAPRLAPRSENEAP